MLLVVTSLGEALEEELAVRERVRGGRYNRHSRIVTLTPTDR